MQLPDFVAELVKTYSCRFCNKKFDLEKVVGVGIKEEKKDTFSGISLCFEYACPHCKKHSFYSGIPITFEEFHQHLLDLMNENPKKHKKPNLNKKTSITDKEVKKFLEEYKNMSYEEFLKKLGIK